MITTADQDEFDNKIPASDKIQLNRRLDLHFKICFNCLN